MYDRNLAGGIPGSGPRRRRRRRNPGWLIALGAGAGLLVAGYCLWAPRAGHAVSSADVQGFLPGPGPGPAAGTSGGAGGWGEGGYPMMSGPPARAGSDGSDGANGADGPAGATLATQMNSQNWAGYAAAGAAGSFTSVSASWAQPAVSCGATDTFSAFWAGLDGDGTATVEQTGTEADCAGGAASYQGWYELFPDAPVFYADPVQPGDAMSASVVSDGGGEFTLTLSDATQGWTQTTQQAAAAAQLGSAEVIAEAPSSGSVLPLADFGTVTFTGATADGAPIGNAADLSELTMESAAGTVLATPSALDGDSAFSVTSGGGPAPTATATAPGGSPAGPGGAAGDGRHHRRVWDWGF